jgi:Holliday junction resolvase RusA-like endonuclease
MSVRRVLGGPGLERVECQVCYERKDLGKPCPDCGFPRIEIQPTATGHLVILPLCPSTNDRMEPMRAGRWAQMRLSSKARDYMETVATELRRRLPEHGVKPVTTWKGIPTWVILPRVNADPHNYFKVSLDAMEKGGAFFDDRYALPRIESIYFSSEKLAIEPLIIYQL